MGRSSADVHSHWMDKLLSSWQDTWRNERGMLYLGVVATEWDGLWSRNWLAKCSNQGKTIEAVITLVVFRKFLVFWLSSRSSEAELIKFVSSGNAEVEWSEQRMGKQLTSYDRNHGSGIWYIGAWRKPILVQNPRLPIAGSIHAPVSRGLLQTRARKVIFDLVSR